jgi:DNA-directed RNA polymerase subunit K/omega
MADDEGGDLDMEGEVDVDANEDFEEGEEEPNSDEDDEDALEKDEEVDNEDARLDGDDEAINCVYRYYKLRKGVPNEDLINDTMLVEDDKQVIGKFEVIDEPRDRITSKYMNYFELTRIIALRTQQLLLGAAPRVIIKDEPNHEKIAIAEVVNKQTPFYLLRPLPGGKKAEKWLIQEMIIPVWHI